MFSSPKRIIAQWKALWEAALSDQQRNKLKMMLDGGNLVFFFRFGEEVHGAPEYEVSVVQYLSAKVNLISEALEPDFVP